MRAAATRKTSSKLLFPTSMFSEPLPHLRSSNFSRNVFLFFRVHSTLDLYTLISRLSAFNPARAPQCLVLRDCNSKSILREHSLRGSLHEFQNQGKVDTKLLAICTHPSHNPRIGNIVSTELHPYLIPLCFFVVNLTHFASPPGTMSEIYTQKAEQALRILRDAESNRDRIAEAYNTFTEDQRFEADETMAQMQDIIERADQQIAKYRAMARDAEAREILMPVHAELAYLTSELEELEEEEDD